MSEVNGNSKNGLPSGWKKIPLGNVCRLKNGFAFKSSNYMSNGTPIIRISDINAGIVETNESVKVEPQKEYEEYLIESGDILIAMSGATTGKFGIYKSNEKAFQNQRVGNFKVIDSSLNKDFLFYQLHSLKRKIEKDAYGGAQPNISSKKIEEMEIVLAPKEEQHQIVSKIEELFSELDKSIEQLKTAQQQLKVYRQSVLNKILTASDFKSIESIIEKLDQGWSPKCDNQQSGNDEWGVIKTSAVQHGYFLEQENKRLPKQLKPREQHELKAGDILITRAGPRVRVGVCCLVKNVRPKLLNCDKVYRIKVNEEIVRPEYLEFVLNTPKYLDEIEKMKTGISDSGVNLTQKAFLKIEVPVPNLEQQQQLIEEAQRQTSIADKLEETIASSLQQAEALKQSVLKKAFEGKL